MLEGRKVNLRIAEKGMERAGSPRRDLMRTEGERR
jgi:hypothetical protein